MGQSVFVLRDLPIIQTPEQELETIIMSLELEGLEPEIVGDSPSPIDFADRQFDVLIIDYGGMAASGAGGFALHNLRYALNWVENHPSVVVLVWTHYTEELARELYDDFSDAPANVFMVGGKSVDQDDAWRKVRAILGISSRA